MMKPERHFFVYIMGSRSRTLYTGHTSKLKKRAWQHKNRVYEGFTCKYHVDRLLWYEHYYDVRSAIARERQIKRWSRQKKLALINAMNPTWLDLSEDWLK